MGANIEKECNRWRNGRLTPFLEVKLLAMVGRQFANEAAATNRNPNSLPC